MPNRRDLATFAPPEARRLGTRAIDRHPDQPNEHHRPIRKGAEPFTILAERIEMIPAPPVPDSPPQDDDVPTMSILHEMRDEKLQKLLDRLDPREADTFELYYLRKKSQGDIAIILGMTQAAISFRVARSFQRLKWMLSEPPIEEADLRAKLLGAFSEEHTEVMIGMWFLTSQTAVARRFGQRQAWVRTRWMTCLNKLRELAEKDPETWGTIFAHCCKVASHPGVLHFQAWHGERPRGSR